MKSASRPPASPGIPLPNGLLPSSPKAETCRRGGDLPRSSSRTSRYTPTQTPMQSPLLCPRGSSIPGPCTQDSIRDPGIKNQLIKVSGGLPVPRGSRSALSSPLHQRRVQPTFSMDTLDLGKPVLINVPAQFSDKNRNTFTNKNQTLRMSNLHPPLFRKGQSTNAVCHSALRDKEAPENHTTQSVMLNNSNLQPAFANMSQKDAIRGYSDSTSQSDEEMGTPEDHSSASSPGLLPPIIFTTAVMSKVAADVLDQTLLDKEDTAIETHTQRINMATVAPFSYRYVV